MDNEKRKNFKRVAESRTNKILHTISLLGNLSNKSYYEYSDDQIEDIFNAIQAELDKQKERILGDNKKVKKFRL